VTEGRFVCSTQYPPSQARPGQPASQLHSLLAQEIHQRDRPANCIVQEKKAAVDGPFATIGLGELQHAPGREPSSAAWKTQVVGLVASPHLSIGVRPSATWKGKSVA